MLHLWWSRCPSIPNLGKENCYEILDGIRYRKEFGLRECSNKNITICKGIFDIGRRVTYATGPRGPAQCVNSIKTRGEVNPHQFNSINTNILRGLHDDTQGICKPTLCTILLVLHIAQTSLRDYQGTKRILAKRKGETSAQQQDQHPVDFTPTIAEICTRENGGYKSMPWGVHKYGEPTHSKKLWEHFTHIGTKITSTPRRNDKEHLDKVRKKSRSPEKKRGRPTSKKFCWNCLLKQTGPLYTAYAIIAYVPRKPYSQTWTQRTVDSFW